MEGLLSENHELLRQAVRKFTEREVKPKASQMDRQGYLDVDLLNKARDMQLFGTIVPEEYGGCGMDFVSLCIILEELSRGCASLPLTIAAHQGICVLGILQAGNELQKRKYLEPLARGEKIGACAATEPEAGSDIGAIQTKAIRKGDKFIINGTKRFITNGGIAEILLVFARVLSEPGGITAFIVENTFPGFKVAKIEDKLGIRASSTAELVFEDLEVPVENVLGEVGKGYPLLLRMLERGGRVTLGAMCLGAAKELLHMSVAYSKLRKQFGKSIGEFQGIQWMLADMATTIYSMESVVYRVAWAIDHDLPIRLPAAACKIICSEGVNEVADKALQIHGGMGYMTELPVERFYRDARINKIYEGTNEIQRNIIGRIIVTKNTWEQALLA